MENNDFTSNNFDYLALIEKISSLETLSLRQILTYYMTIF